MNLLIMQTTTFTLKLPELDIEQVLVAPLHCAQLIHLPRGLQQTTLPI
jgi:hypothetical protein